jgi:hypothetical protein
MKKMINFSQKTVNIKKIIFKISRMGFHIKGQAAWFSKWCSV